MKHLILYLTSWATKHETVKMIKPVDNNNLENNKPLSIINMLPRHITFRNRVSLSFVITFMLLLPKASYEHKIKSLSKNRPNDMHKQLSEEIKRGDIKALARAISFIENDQPGYEDLLRSAKASPSAKIIGVTGPPGAGKSTLVDSMISELITDGKKIAVICVDPSSPFNLGAVLGDRIRMSQWYTHPNVFIRSLATRGSVGGLSPKILEITDLVRSAGFDSVIVETVGVGQSEIEIAGLADITVVVLIPETGDEVQTMKAGLMEIADIFVINKSDRPDADLLEKNLRLMMAGSREKQPPIFRTVATEKKGIGALIEAIRENVNNTDNGERHLLLLIDKAWQLLVKKRMKDVNKDHLKKMIENEYRNKDFNLYSFVERL
jgi:LAO/AO transport system kinase